MWNIIVKILIADSLEKIVEHRSGRNAIHVVVAVNNDAFVFFYRQNDAIGSFLCIFQEKRIVGRRKIRFKESPRLFGRLDAAAMQQSHRQIGIFNQLFAHVCGNFGPKRVVHLSIITFFLSFPPPYIFSGVVNDKKVK